MKGFKSNKQRKGFFSKIKNWNEQRRKVHLKKLDKKEKELEQEIKSRQNKLEQEIKSRQKEARIREQKRQELAMRKNMISESKRELKSLKKQKFETSFIGKNISGTKQLYGKAVSGTRKIITSPKTKKLYKNIRKIKLEW